MNSLYGAVLPIMHGGPPAPAVVDTNGEDAEEEEEAGHAEAHLVDGGVAHQSLAALPCAHLFVEGELGGGGGQKKTTHIGRGLHQLMPPSGKRDAGVCLERRSDDWPFWTSRL